MSSSVAETREALDGFFASIEGDAFRLARAATADADEALDIVQDAMLTLVRRYADKDESEWRPLFHRVLQNRIRDWYRRQRVRRIVERFTGEGASDADAFESAERTPDALVSAGGTLSRVESALAELPQRQRQVFLLRVWQEMSVEETAHAMSISTGSVKTHLSRALGRLRIELGPDPEAPVEEML